MSMDSLPSTDMPGPRQMGAALLIVRIASAQAFLYHGSGILFGAFGDGGPQSFASAFHMPVAAAVLVGLGQLTAGLAVLTGVLIRLGALGIIALMMGAIVLVHLPHGFDVSKGGMEYALTQLLLAVAFLIAGAGRYSLGSWLPRPLRKL
jgi:putative oxidoreductase